MRRCVARSISGLRSGWWSTAAPINPRSVCLAMAAAEPGLTVFVLPENHGKGAAVLFGLRQAQRAGFTHALTMDSDGQHPAERIGHSCRRRWPTPGAMVLGCPVFDASAPGLRVKGRQISNWWANLETLWAGIHDSLYGFRVYPIDPLIAVMRRQPWMRRFDFDVEAVVRLCWRGIRPINLPAAGALFSSRGGRRLALQLLARQRIADLDAPAALLRLHFAPAAARRAALAEPRLRVRRAQNPAGCRVAARVGTYIMPAT